MIEINAAQRLKATQGKSPDAPKGVPPEVWSKWRHYYSNEQFSTFEWCVCKEDITDIPKVTIKKGDIVGIDYVKGDSKLKLFLAGNRTPYALVTLPGRAYKMVMASCNPWKG
jgi:hypothetical protein